MEKLTYKQAYDMIINAYFKNEINPMKGEFCFCGTLAPDAQWGFTRRDKEYPYSQQEYRRMEHMLLRQDGKSDLWGSEITGLAWGYTPTYEKFEDDLFIGMYDALEELKKIHIERGENVNDVPEFTKRSLKPV